MKLGTLMVIGLTILAALELVSVDGARRGKRGKKRKNKNKRRDNGDARPRREIIPGKFKNDRQVRRYLKMVGADIMIWRCRDSITETYESEPIEFIELYCEVLGNIAKIEWFHDFKKINVDGKRHALVSFPHFYRGRYFFKWMDLLLRIPKVTVDDSGVYTIKVKGQSGTAEEHTIFVNISQRDKDAVRVSGSAPATAPVAIHKKKAADKAAIHKKKADRARSRRRRKHRSRSRRNKSKSKSKSKNSKNVEQ